MHNMLLKCVNINDPFNHELNESRITVAEKEEKTTKDNVRDFSQKNFTNFLDPIFINNKNDKLFKSYIFYCCKANLDQNQIFSHPDLEICFSFFEKMNKSYYFLFLNSNWLTLEKPGKHIITFICNKTRFPVVVMSLAGKLTAKHINSARKGFRQQYKIVVQKQLGIPMSGTMFSYKNEDSQKEHVKESTLNKEHNFFFKVIAIPFYTPKKEEDMEKIYNFIQQNFNNFLKIYLSKIYDFKKNPNILDNFADLENLDNLSEGIAIKLKENPNVFGLSCLANKDAILSRKTIRHQTITISKNAIVSDCDSRVPYKTIPKIDAEALNTFFPSAAQKLAELFFEPEPIENEYSEEKSEDSEPPIIKKIKR